MLPDHPVNSRSWWEEYFLQHWDANHGSAQTAYFMDRLLEGLTRRAREHDYLSRTPLDVLDWGCAFGEGAQRLAEAFPNASLTGLDFAGEAVSVARRRYPGLKFVQTEGGRIPQDYDVIVTSNCLEHFDDPIAVARGHLASCRKLYLAMVPHAEDPLCESHRARFDERTFPDRIGGFRRLFTEVVATEAPFWNGRQLLVAYGSAEYLGEVGSREAESSRFAAGPEVSDRERAKWDAYYGSIADPEESPASIEFGDELALRLAEILPNGGRILEAGCGAGQQSMALARSGRYDLTLMDFSEEALSQARRWFQRSGVKASFVAQDVLRPGQAEHDLVFNAGVLEHYTFDEQVRFLRGMASRSQRFVLALVPNRLCYWYWVWRLRACAGGEWPFGKEVPMVDLAPAFEAAGLTFLGQFVGGATWSENFINYLPGLDEGLRDLILSVHRSPVIPSWQKGYLVGALGSKGERPTLSMAWSPTWPTESFVASEATATLADALAMAVAGEQRLKQSKVESDLRLAEAKRSLAEAEARQAEARVSWETTMADQEEAHRQERDLLDTRHAERVAAFASTESILRGRIDEEARVIVGLAARIDELTTVNAQERAEAAQRDSEQEARIETARLRIEEVAWWADTQAAEIRAMKSGAAWRFIEFARKAGRKVAPSGSLPSRAARLGLLAVKKARQGPGPFARAVLRRLPVNSRSRSLPRPQFVLPERVSTPSTPTGPGFGVPGLVTVVLPVYNQADLLAGAIESVLAQSYQEFELIIINDGSKDGVESVLAEYAGRPGVRILTQSNQKLPKALSNGFDHALGEFWTWTSADNFMHPDQLARQVAFFRENPRAAMVYADYFAIDDRGEPLGDPGWRPHNRSTPDDHAIHLPRNTSALNTVQDNFIGPCFMYRGWVGRLIGEYDPNLGVEDYDYWMRINNLFRIEHLGTDEPLYHYRVHDNSLSGRAVELRIVERAWALMEYERDRAAFYDEPWTMVVDSEVATLIGGECEGDCKILTWQGGEWPWGDSPGGKTLAMVGPSSLPALAEADRPDGLVVATWFGGDPEAPYDARVALRSLEAGAFAADRATSDRLALLNASTIQLAPSPGLLPIVLRWANNRAFYERTRPESLRRREAPSTFLPVGRRVRVVIQVDGFTQGGMEQVVLSAAETLDPKKFQLTLLVLGEQGDAVAKARAAGLRVVILPETDRDAHYRHLLSQERIDVVNAHYSTYGAAMASELGVPFVQTVHNTYVWLDPEKVAEYRSVDAFTTAYVCVSDEVARYTELRLGLSTSKALVFPNGVDTRRFAAAGPPGERAALRRSLGIAPEDFVFLNVASIHATKAQTPAVLALAELARTYPEARLVLLGRALDPNYLADLRRQVDRHRLNGSVVLAGHHDDPLPFYRSADAFLLPSYWEGWSLALAEAMASGLPAVASDVGAARDLITPRLGRLVRPPFGSITELDWLTIAPLVRASDPGFVTRLADAMRSVREQSARITPSSGFLATIDQRKAYRAHGELYSWLAQGGRPEAARTWGASRSSESIASENVGSIRAA